MALGTSQKRAKRFHALSRGIRAPMVRMLRRFFRAQAARVVERYLSNHAVKAELDDEAGFPPQAEELLPESERRALFQIITPFVLQIMLSTRDLAGHLVHLPVGNAQIIGGLIDIGPEHDPRLQRLLSEVHLHIAGAHDTTLNAIRDVLADGYANHRTIRQIARDLKDVVTETYSGRALTIARTELANARQLAAIETFQEAGIAMVQVVDGSGCQWVTHDSGGAANGTRRTLIDAQAHPLAHPNCQRIFIPAR